MEANFWHQRWKNNEIGFHEGTANALLVAYVERLGLKPGARILLPLCGKTRDIAWLLSQGYRVAGAELSALAITQLFQELGVEPSIEKTGALDLYRGPNLDIFVGDIFALTRETLGAVDAVYDRAALVAFPPDMRARYAAHLLAISNAAPQLLINFEYDQSLIAGPPFSVSGADILSYYRDSHRVARLAQREIPGGLKGKVPAVEAVWLLDRSV